MIRFCCPKCRKILKAVATGAGRKTTCPGCGQLLIVPSPDRNSTILSESRPDPDTASVPPTAPFPDWLPEAAQPQQHCPSPATEPLASPPAEFDALGEAKRERTSPLERRDLVKNLAGFVTGRPARNRQIVITIAAIAAAAVFGCIAVANFHGGNACLAVFLALIASVLVIAIACVWGSACSQCRRWWASIEGTTELIGEKPTWTTVTRKIRHFSRKGEGAGWSEYDERVPAVQRTYRHHFACKYCGHCWTTTSSLTRAVIDAADDQDG